MIRVCCYCDKELGVKKPLEDKSVTHGICDDCFEQKPWLRKTQRTKPKNRRTANRKSEP